MSPVAVSLCERRRRWWGRLWHTPLADVVRLRLTGRLDVKGLIAEADLPEPLRQLVRRVVKMTRLWRCEKVDVAQELIDHFGDGLAGGQSPDGLIEAFGDPRQAARLIRRAKRRNRPLFWRIWGRTIQAAGWTLAALIVLYVAILVRFLWGTPNIAWNYTAELNAEAKAVPEDDRAWPLYREALVKLEPVPEDVGGEHSQPSIWEFSDASPEQTDQWKALSAYVGRNQQSIELARRAAARPHLGFWYGNPADAVPFPADPRREHLVPSLHSENPMVMAMALEHVQQLRLLAMLLRADARLGVKQRQGARVVADLVAQLGIYRHSYDAERFLICDLVGLASLGMVFDTLGETLADAPGTFSNLELHELAHEIAAVGGGGPVRMQWEGERAVFRDVCQRMYTDNGRGDGRLTPDGMVTLQETVNTSPALTAAVLSQSWRARLCLDLAGSAASLVLADRREMFDLADRLYDQTELESQRPLWQWSESEVDQELKALANSPVEKIRYTPILIFLPAAQAVGQAAERATQRRDAALVVIALELYRRHTGEWPDRLDQLVPDLLPAVPPDRFDGRPLRYRVVDGRPVVYSIGVDRRDDGGVPPEFPQAEPDRWQPPGPVDTRDRGDWVFWPPVNDSSKSSK